MATCLRIILDKRREKKDGTYPIAFRVLHGRIQSTIGSGYSVHEEYWDKQKKAVKRGCKTIPDITYFNYLLKKKEFDLTKKIRELDEKGVLEDMTMKELKKELTRERKEKKPSFMAFTADIIQNLKNEERYGMAAAYKDALAFLRKYGRINDITFKEITPDYLRLLEKRYIANGRNHYNGLAVYMRAIRAVFNRAIVAGYVKEAQYPFRKTTLDQYKYHIRTEKTKKRAVSKEVIRKIENLTLENESLLKYKYYFLFMFYTRGMNMVDLAWLKKENIEHGRLTYKRAKTGKTYTMRLNQKAWEILRWFGYKDKKDWDFLFPIIKNPNDRERINVQIKNAISHTNKGLGKIADMLGIEIKMTTYVSRHTWATIADKKGIDRRIISQGLGHSDLHTTEIYINDIVSTDDLDAANDIITGD